MNDPGRQQLPRLLKVAILGVLALTLLAIAAIGAGLFDPRPAGQLITTVEPGKREVGPGEMSLEWLVIDQGVGSAGQSPTYRLSAAFVEGETDSGYGLALGDQQHYLVAAVSPLGYVAVWESDLRQSQPSTVFYWQPWPHTAAGTQTNEIWLKTTEVAGRDWLTVRINRELLWQGPVSMPGRDAGLWMGSFGQAAIVDFLVLEQFVEQRP